MRPSLITCIVPVFNGECYIKEALDSILAQTYGPVEIITVDDGSTDKTAAVVATYGKQVRYIWQQNAGPGAARNLGISLAQGEFIAFQDADDLWHPEKLEHQMARFKTRTELEMCVTHIQNFWIPELQDEAQRFQNHRRAQALPGYVTTTLLARRTLFDKVGMFNPTFMHVHDSEWFVRVKELGMATELLPEVLAYRRLHHTNRSRDRAGASRDEYLQLLKDTLDRRRGIENTAKN